MYDHYLDIAVQISKDAGAMMRTGFSLKVETEWKADHSPLTQTDTKINAMVISSITEKFPDHAVVGEEQSTEHTADQSKFVWVCDPIDGTFPFSHGLNISSFSLALVEDGDPVVGVVYDPFQGLMFTASKNQHTKLNGEEVDVSEADTLEDKIIAGEAIGSDGRLYVALRESKARILTCQSFIFGAKMVASGHFIGAVFGAGNPWDVAALKIIIEQAGGQTSDFFGNSQRYDRYTRGFVASNGIVHKQLLDIIKKSGHQPK